MTRITFALLTIILGLAVAPADTAAQAFLKLEGVAGETRESLNEKWISGGFARADDWIEVESWTWGSAGAARPGARPLVIVRRPDRASELLGRLHSERRRVPAILVVRSPGSREPEYYRFDGLYITTYRPHSADYPTETISFNFSKVETVP
jgi:type VI protein secretion system component Hcp